MVPDGDPASTGAPESTPEPEVNIPELVHELVAGSSAPRSGSSATTILIILGALVGLTISFCMVYFIGRVQGELGVRREQVANLSARINTLETRPGATDSLPSVTVPPDKLLEAVVTLATDQTEARVMEALVEMNGNSQDIILGLAGQQVDLDMSAIENQTNLQMTLLENWSANFPPAGRGDLSYSENRMDGWNYFGSLPHQGCVEIGNSFWDPSHSF